MKNRIVLFTAILIALSVLIFSSCDKDNSNVGQDVQPQMDNDTSDVTSLETETEKYVAPEGMELPWEEAGKLPSEYTWDEFLALTGDQQIVFQQCMGEAAFEEWMNRVCQDSETEVVDDFHVDVPWDEGGKQPSEYTWDEFLALTGDQQIVFQQCIGEAAFEAWMNSVCQDSDTDDVDDFHVDVPWKEGGKQPSEYTWDEFLALNGDQQIVFQQSFESYEEFEKWMEKVNPEQVQ